MIDIDEQFPLSSSLCYLNHAAMGPWPKRTAAAVAAFAEENMREGATHYERWLKTEQELRQALARLLNAPSSDDIALLKNTSEGLSLIAYGIEWAEGDEILLLEHEFPSNRIVWESLRAKGVNVKVLETLGGDDAEDTLIANASERTRLITVSSVQYASGLRMDLQRLSRFCQQQNILLCIDAIQSLGALPFDIQETAADFVVADGHKWMLGPEGIAVFYCAPKQRQRLTLHQYGWHMVKALGDYDRSDWQVADSARRFECGSPNMLGIHALNASLDLLLEVGIDVIARQMLTNTRYLIEQLGNDPKVTITSVTESGRHGGIVTFRHSTMDSAALYRGLRANNVICAHRGGGIRFSPHFYNSQQQLDYAVETVQRLVQAA